MAAFVVTTMDLDEDEYVRQIWLWDGSEARPITSGRADMSPRWSPDGSTIAFLRKGPADDDKPQIALLPMSGGEGEVITEVENGVSSIAWSPDGTRLAITIADYVDGIEDEEERARAPRRISHPSFRFDNQGWTYDKRSHIHVVDVATREVTQITKGEYSESPPAWSPDGAKLAYLSAAHDEAWTKPRNQVFVVSSEGGESLARTPLGQWGWAGFGPDGALYAIGQECEAFTLKPDPFVRIADDSEISVLADLDRNLMPGHPAGILAKPRFLADGTVTCVLEDRGAQTVITIAPDGSTGVLAEGSRLITGFDPTPDGSRAFLTATAPRNPGELFVWEGGAEKQLTDFNGEFSALLIERARGPRLGAPSAGRGQGPCPVQHPWRSRDPIRLGILRRVSGVCRRRLRGRGCEPRREFRVRLRAREGGARDMGGRRAGGPRRPDASALRSR